MSTAESIPTMTARRWIVVDTGASGTRYDTRGARYYGKECWAHTIREAIPFGSLDAAEAALANARRLAVGNLIIRPVRPRRDATGEACAQALATTLRERDDARTSLAAAKADAARLSARVADLERTLRQVRAKVCERVGWAIGDEAPTVKLDGRPVAEPLRFKLGDIWSDVVGSHYVVAGIDGNDAFLVDTCVGTTCRLSVGSVHGMSLHKRGGKPWTGAAS